MILYKVEVTRKGASMGVKRYYTNPAQFAKELKRTRTRFAKYNADHEVKGYEANVNWRELKI